MSKLSILFLLIFALVLLNFSCASRTVYKNISFDPEQFGDEKNTVSHAGPCAIWATGDGISEQKLVYTYDGTTLTAKDIDHNGTESRVEYRHEPRTDNTVLRYYDERDGELVFSHEEKLDANGNVIEKYFSNGKLMRKWKYSYDENGNWIEKKVVFPNREVGLKRSIEIAKREYDENGNLLSTLYDTGKDGEYNSSMVYHYYENSKLVQREETVHPATGDIHEVVTYKYDAAGNLIDESYTHTKTGKSFTALYSYSCW